MKATDLARYLRQIYGSGAIKEEAAAKVAPGLRTATLSSLNGSGSTTSASQVTGGMSTAQSATPTSDESEEDADSDSSDSA
nr:hypothetical protein [Tanacetum cinerariifolium]